MWGLNEMGRRNASISLAPDVVDYVDQYMKDGGNLSGLISYLLRGYFTGSDTKMAGVMQTELKSRMSSLQAELSKLSEDMNRLNTVTESAKKEEEEKAAGLEPEIRKAFTEMEAGGGGVDYWRGIAGGEIQNYVRVRASNLAGRLGVSYPDMISAVIDIYPALKNYLN